MTKSRVVPVPGAPNFRDLGGYAAGGGKTVKWSLLYRSDDLGDVDPDGVEIMGRLGIRTVVDFRDRKEMAYSPDNLPDSVLNVVKIPIDAGSLMQSFSDEHLNHRKAVGMMISVYRALVEDFQPSYKRFFEEVLRQDCAPLLFHCTAGKDRTGVGAALLLLGLGVNRDDVAADYILSRELLRTKFISGVDYDSAMEPLYSVRPEFLAAALDVVDSRYGGPETYLTERLGVDLVRLRELYTEQAG